MSVLNVISLLLFATMVASGQALFKSVGLVLRADGMAAALRAPFLYAALMLDGATTAL